eukprot:4296632-Alexandrium_andersonii.AAC.1
MKALLKQPRTFHRPWQLDGPLAIWSKLGHGPPNPTHCNPTLPRGPNGALCNSEPADPSPPVKHRSERRRGGAKRGAPNARLWKSGAFKAAEKSVWPVGRAGAATQF